MTSELEQRVCRSGDAGTGTERRRRMSVFFRSAMLALVCAVFVIGVITPAPSDDPATSTRSKDVDLFAAIIARLEQGMPYYEATNIELRARGYPTASVMNWRTPLHGRAIAALSIPRARVVIALLGIVLLLATAWALAPRGPVVAAVGVVCMLGATAPLHVAVLFSEAWCGVFMALSLAAYARQRWVAAALCGAAAVYVRELAVPYALICGLTALHARRRSESLVWIAGGISYLVYYAIHASLAYTKIQPGDLAHAYSWVRWQGLPFVYETARWYGWTTLAPQVLAPLVVAAGLAATVARSMPVQMRLAIVTYIVVLAAIGQPFNSYWGLVTAPVWAFALAYSAEGLRRLLDLDRYPRSRAVSVSKSWCSSVVQD